MNRMDAEHLRNLLTSWRCEILFNLFIEEDITLEDLKLIKYSHVRQLLQSYKMGIRIRFEHYLEKWRNEIGKPLDSNGDGQCRPLHDEYSYCRRSSKNSKIAPQEIKKSPASEPISSVAENPKDFNNIQTPVEAPPPAASAPMPTENDLLTRADSQISPDNLITNQAFAMRLARKRPIEETPAERTLDRSFYSLTYILQRSASKGAAILKYYEDHNEFTNTQRSQLIQIICDYFEDNDYHLSLNMSHEIEADILHMFPTERLQNYRTEKRGKIYVKYTNLKRYKKERQKAAYERQLGHDKGNEYSFINVQNMAESSNYDNNLDTGSCETWPEGADSAIHIKTEDVSDS